MRKVVRFRLKAYDTSQGYLSKATLKKAFRCGMHTCTSFYFRKSTFTNRTSSIPESFISHTVSSDWPVRQIQELSDVS